MERWPRIPTFPTLPVNVSFPGGGDAPAPFVPSAYHAFFVGGQSNSEGRPDDDGLSPFPVGTLQVDQAGNIIPAVHPLSSISPDPRSMGFAADFATLYRVANPTVAIVFVPSGQGGTGYADFKWNPPSDTNYVLARNRLNALMAANPTFQMKGFLWHQGERDAAFPNTYAALQDAMIAGFRSTVTGASAAPFVVGGLQPNYVNPPYDHPAMNLVIEDTRNRVVQVAYASSAGLVGIVGDDIHFDTPSLRELGKRYYAAYLIAEQNSNRVPGTVPDLTATPLAGRVDLEWGWPVGFPAMTDYSIEFSTNGGSSWTAITRSASATRAYTHTGLTGGVAHLYRVKATNSNGTSAAWSATASATPSAALPPIATTGFSSGAIVATQAAFPFPTVTIPAGTGIIGIASRGTGAGNVAIPSSVDFGGTGAVLVGSVGVDTNRSAVSFWKLPNHAGGTATLTVTFPNNVQRCAYTSQTVTDANHTTAAFTGSGAFNITAGGGGDTRTIANPCPTNGLAIVHGFNIGTGITVTQGGVTSQLAQTLIDSIVFHICGYTTTPGGNITQVLSGNTTAGTNVLGILSIEPA